MPRDPDARRGRFIITTTAWRPVSGSRSRPYVGRAARICSRYRPRAALAVAGQGGSIDRAQPSGAGEITRLVERWGEGDEVAFDRLIELVYDDLRQIAHRHLRLDRPDHTINTTALVHEAYVRLAQQQQGVWRSRAQFFAFASRAMRHILIDYARRQRAAKRGGTRVQVPLHENVAAVEAEAAELLVLDEALEMLAQRSERMARVVECRFFGGLSVAETAEALDASVRTIEREWTRARAYLYRALSQRPPVPEAESGGSDAGDGS
jgi:RNA polymerase sigma factor (TIGR02999 family)